MTTTLITGANKGLGYETARRLTAEGHTVYLGCRNADRGARAADELGARLVVIDVTDAESVAAAVDLVAAGGGLDVLVNNAGVEGRGPENSIPGVADVTVEQMQSVFDTNVFGTLRVTRAFLPLLERSAAPVIVNLSSGLASLTGLSAPDSPTHFYPGVSYPASKTVVNVMTIQFAKAFPEMRVNAVEPGYTNTDLNGRTGTQTVEQGADIIVRMALVAPDGPTGTFVSSHGALAW